MSTETDKRLHPHEIPPATRNGRPMVDGGAGEDPIDVIAARYNLTRKQAEEIFQHFDETMNSGDQMLRGSLSEAVGQAVRARDQQWIASFGKTFSILLHYSAKQRPEYRYAAMVTMCYVTGFTDEADATSFSDIARKHLAFMRMSEGKATVNKCARLFIEKLKLAPMLTMRTEAARKEMQKARLQQISKTESEQP